MSGEYGKRITIRLAPRVAEKLELVERYTGENVSDIVRGCIHRMAKISDEPNKIRDFVDNMTFPMIRDSLLPTGEVKYADVPRITVRLTSGEVSYIEKVAKTLGINASSALRIAIVWCLKNKMR